MRVISGILIWAVLAFAQSDPLVDGIEKFRNGDYLGAEAALRKIDDARGRLFLALARAATGRCAEVETSLRDAFESNQDPRLRKLAGLGYVQCRLAGDDSAAAYPVLAALRQAYPDDADVLYETARLHMRAWNDTVHRMFEKTPASWRVNQISAEIFEIQGQFDEAVSEYRKAIEKNPSAVNLHYRLARALLMRSHDAEALELARQEFEKELEFNPNDAVAHYQIGQILLAQQKRDEGVARLVRVVELAPNFSRGLVALAKLRMEDHRTDDAIRLLERAVRVAPDSESAHYSLMRAYLRAHRKEDALRQKKELDKLQRPPQGEFTDFLKRIGERKASGSKPQIPRR